MPHAFPSRAVGKLLAISIDGIPIMLATTGIKINLADLSPSLSLPDVSDNIEENDNRQSQV